MQHNLIYDKYETKLPEEIHFRNDLIKLRINKSYQ